MVDLDEHQRGESLKRLRRPDITDLTTLAQNLPEFQAIGVSAGLAVSVAQVSAIGVPFALASEAGRILVERRLAVLEQTDHETLEERMSSDPDFLIFVADAMDVAQRSSMAEKRTVLAEVVSRALGGDSVMFDEGKALVRSLALVDKAEMSVLTRAITRSPVFDDSGKAQTLHQWLMDEDIPEPIVATLVAAGLLRMPRGGYDEAIRETELGNRLVSELQSQGPPE